MQAPYSNLISLISWPLMQIGFAPIFIGQFLSSSRESLNTASFLQKKKRSIHLTVCELTLNGLYNQNCSRTKPLESRGARLLRYPSIWHCPEWMKESIFGFELCYSYSLLLFKDIIFVNKNKNTFIEK